MNKLILIAILTAAVQLHAEESPWDQDSNWTQQESGAVNAFEATIKNVNPKGLKVTFEKLEPGEAPVVQTLKICTQDAAVNESNPTEADRAIAINRLVQEFHSAKKTGDLLKVGIRGPWNPCIYPISI
ncbi:MAG: hypothetical protein ACXVA9_06775 [Bdellovibrionales bacterium]